MIHESYYVVKKVYWRNILQTYLYEIDVFLIREAAHSIQFNMIYSINIQHTLKPCEHAVHIMLFEGNTQVCSSVHGRRSVGT